MKEKNRIKIPADLTKKFRETVTRHSGLYFKDQGLGNLEDTILQRMEVLGLTAPAGYYVYLTTSEERESEFRELLNLLTVNHTYFFRNESQFKALRENILPEIIKRKLRVKGVRPSLRIWSAGCSTGEEPYSIAMVIRDLIGEMEEWDITILATDASSSALTRARRGIYGKSSMRLVEKDIRAKYFQPVPDTREYRVREEIRGMVRFDYLNLVNSGFLNGFDLIFCRNVVIYFKLETMVELMNRFYSSLDDKGFLFVGYSESLQFISDRFELVESVDAIIYRKSLPGCPRYSGAEASPQQSALSEVSHPPLEMKIKTARVEEILKEISRAEVKADEVKTAASPGEMERILVESVKALHLKQYDRTIELAEKARYLDRSAVEPYYLAAEAYANRGEFGLAREELNAALTKDLMYAPAHYLLGVIHREEDGSASAEERFRKALYIDGDFIMALFQLAGLYKDEGRDEDALRQYRNTMNTLSGLGSSEIIAYSGGFNASTLISICRSNIERLK